MSNNDVNSLYEQINSPQFDQNEEISDKMYEQIIKLVETKPAHQFPATEMAKPDKEEVSIARIANSPEEMQLFTLHCLAFKKEVSQRVKGNETVYVGIDYEFNNRQIALMQICLERGVERKNHLWAINPAEFSDRDNEIMLDCLMRNKDVFKILHGADSLDIPYMFEIMFGGDYDTIRKFTSRTIDTRFLCEFALAATDKERKCNIYDTLFKFGTITEQQYHRLIEIHDGMGPVQDISWNIHKMSSYHIHYAFYDVLFLRRMMLDIYHYIKREAPKYDPFVPLFTRLFQFIILERRDVTNVLAEAKKEIDPMNNYLFKHQGRNVTMVTVYQQLMTYLAVPEIGLYMDSLMMISYFRTHLSIFVKRIIYAVILERKRVMENKVTIHEGKLSFEEFVDKIRENKLKGIPKIAEELHKVIVQKFELLYP